MHDAVILTFRGVRGSAPTPGAHTLRYGGNTSCLDVTLSPRRRLVIDCGSGLRNLERDLPADPGPAGLHFDVFLTHYHTDHLEGLRFFRPLYDARSRFTFHGFPSAGLTVEQSLAGPMRPPWFPVAFGETASEKRFVELSGEPLSVEGIRITPAEVPHPQGAASFRLERDGRSIVFATDTEAPDAGSAEAVRRLAREADVLIHDAQYTPEEYAAKYRDWGHSTWEHAVEAARAAGVRRLILFHHDPERSDADLDHLLEQARGRFPAVDAAYEGMTVEL